MEVKNAVIKSTNLGINHTDHGILSFYIHLDYGGGGQGYGGLTLDTNNPPRHERGLSPEERDKMPVRLATTLATELLLGIDAVFGCDWEKLPGTSCRAYSDRTTVRAIGHYLKDKWLWMKQDGDDYLFVVTTLDEVEG